MRSPQSLKVEKGRFLEVAVLLFLIVILALLILPEFWTKKPIQVPEAYYEFVMHYAPYFYVRATNMTQDPAQQKNVTVVDGSEFQVGYPVEIRDYEYAEWNRVAA